MVNVWDTRGAVSGQITANDILQLAHALKEEAPFIPLLPMSPSDLEWLKQREQYARDITTAFDLEVGNIRLIQELKSTYSTDASWYFAMETYNQVRYLSQVHTPSRKLRKCQMRKIYAQRRRLRRFYGL